MKSRYLIATEILAMVVLITFIIVQTTVPVFAQNSGIPSAEEFNEHFQRQSRIAENRRTAWNDPKPSKDMVKTLMDDMHKEDAWLLDRDVISQIVNIISDIKEHLSDLPKELQSSANDLLKELGKMKDSIEKAKSQNIPDQWIFEMRSIKDAQGFSGKIQGMVSGIAYAIKRSGKNRRKEKAILEYLDKLILRFNNLGSILYQKQHDINFMILLRVYSIIQNAFISEKTKADLMSQRPLYPFSPDAELIMLHKLQQMIHAAGGDEQQALKDADDLITKKLEFLEKKQGAIRTSSDRNFASFDANTVHLLLDQFAVGDLVSLAPGQGAQFTIPYGNDVFKVAFKKLQHNVALLAGIMQNGKLILSGVCTAASIFLPTALKGMMLTLSSNKPPCSYIEKMKLKASIASLEGSLRTIRFFKFLERVFTSPTRYEAQLWWKKDYYQKQYNTEHRLPEETPLPDEEWTAIVRDLGIHEWVYGQVPPPEKNQVEKIFTVKELKMAHDQWQAVKKNIQRFNQDISGCSSRVGLEELQKNLQELQGKVQQWQHYLESSS